MTSPTLDGQTDFGPALYQKIGLVLGPVVAVILYFLPPPDTLTPDGWLVVAIAALMAIWWATEAIPVPATSMLPIVLMPLLGITTLKETTLPYASPIIFLLLGGFIVAMGMRRWDLHKRIALHILIRSGDHPASLIGGFMAASALLSMWISNTATTLMMVPIALSVCHTILGDRMRGHMYPVALLIGCAWASSIGGLGTIIGTPPNAFLVSFMAAETGTEIGFLQWMMLGVPVVILMVPLAWFVLTKIAFKFDASDIKGGSLVVGDALDDMGKITVPEKRVATIFLIMALAWSFRPALNDISILANLSDVGIAVAGAIAMFMVPSGSRLEENSMLLTWEDAVQLPWGVILLFGGGLSLAAAISSTGVAAWIGNGLSGLATLHLFVLSLGIVGTVIFLTELTSNTATTAALVPVLAAVAVSADMNPILLAAPTAMAASCAFMLPVATAPNAVIYSSGFVRIPQMAKAGLWLNIMGTFLISALCYWLVPVVFVTG